MNNNEFQEILSYKFKDQALLDLALTHSSYANEEKVDVLYIYNNERLEFIGDAFLDAIIGVELFIRLKKTKEGKLSRLRSFVVCEKALAFVSRKLNVGEFLNMGYGEEHAGGRNKDSILADAFEAIIGAIYVDGGYDAAREFVLSELGQLVDDAIAGKLHMDYKSEVQEILQKDGTSPKIVYKVDHAEGPNHDRTFFVHLTCNGVKMGSGMGKSKKEAEQNAAKATLEGGYIE